jgi:hypothetical protein
MEYLSLWEVRLSFTSILAMFFLASDQFFSIEIYAEDGPPVDIADRLSASLPLNVVKSIHQRVTKFIKTLDQLR